MTTLVVDRVTIGPAGTTYAVVDGVSIDVGPGEVLGVVGETAAGKTTLGLAALGELRDGMELRSGEVRLPGGGLVTSSRRTPATRQGTRVGHVAQHAASSLNPALRVGALLASVHDARDAGVTPGGHVRDVLRAVSLPDSDEFLGRYPHQLSGGQAQRVAIALALAGSPEVVVLDEPTSGLDPVTAARILATVRGLSREHGLAVVCISHDLAAIADVADRLVVLYAGHVVEEGPARAVLADPAHPYTRHLVAAVPSVEGGHAVGLPGRAPSLAERGRACRFASRCDLARDDCRREVPLSDVGSDRRARCVDPFAVPHRLRATARPPVPQRARSGSALSVRGLTAVHGDHAALHDVSFDVAPGEWLAVVGQSGAGKTTLIRAIAGIHARRSGLVELDGAPLADSVRRRSRSQRSSIRLVSQDPKESFNPRRPVGQSVARPLRLAGVDRASARREIEAVLARVALDAGVLECLPGELSGGELQRAAIARALVGGPRILLGDEITSLLDSVVQGAIVELLHEIHVGIGLTMVLVTHDLGLVRAVSDRTAVLAGGRLVEIGRTADVFDAPRHDATVALLEHRRRRPGASSDVPSSGRASHV